MVRGAKVKGSRNLESCLRAEDHSGGIHQIQIGVEICGPKSARDGRRRSASHTGDDAVNGSRAFEGRRRASRHIEAGKTVEEIVSNLMAEVCGDQEIGRSSESVGPGADDDGGAQ
jgi:hypothetical protein